MKHLLFSTVMVGGLVSACGSGESKSAGNEEHPTDTAAVITSFTNAAFADLQVLSYDIPGFDKLSLVQKKLEKYHDRSREFG